MAMRNASFPEKSHRQFEWWITFETIHCEFHVRFCFSYLSTDDYDFFVVFRVPGGSKSPKISSEFRFYFTPLFVDPLLFFDGNVCVCVWLLAMRMEPKSYPQLAHNHLHLIDFDFWLPEKSSCGNLEHEYSGMGLKHHTKLQPTIYCYWSEWKIICAGLLGILWIPKLLLMRF